MAVCLRGKKWWYNFVVKGKKYQGALEGVDNEPDARKAAKAKKRMIEKASDQKSVQALIDNFRMELSGSRTILLEDAWQLAAQKPAKKTASESWLKAKEGCWKDFAAFIAATHPEAKAVTDITVPMAEEYVSHIRSKGRFVKTIGNRTGRSAYANKNENLSTRTKNGMVENISGVFKALKSEIGNHNPFSDIPKLQNIEVERAVFSLDEIQRILNGDDSVAVPIFRIALYTGLREGDICNLEWRQIDFANRMIARHQNKTRKDVKIPMMPQICEYLSSLPQTSQYVLPDIQKIYASNRSTISRRIKKYLRKIGIETNQKTDRSRKSSVKDLHSCRHTFCWLAGQAGIPLPTVQAIVGHMTPTMTEHYAAHVTDAQKKAQIEALAAILPSQGSNLRCVLMDLAASIPDDRVDEAIRLLQDLQGKASPSEPTA